MREEEEMEDCEGRGRTVKGGEAMRGGQMGGEVVRRRDAVGREGGL